MSMGLFAPYNCDAYKLGHISQYPEGTNLVFSNFTARSNKYLEIPELYKDGKYVVAGLSRFISEFKHTWHMSFFSHLDYESFEEELKDWQITVAPFVGPNGSDKIAQGLKDLWELGSLPLEFVTVPEGTILDINQPCLCVYNTDPKFYWLVNFIETWLSADLWKTMTTATIARYYRKVLEEYCLKTGGIKEFVDWQAHDFSVRGMSNLQDAAWSGLGHLLYFTGTDNIPATVFARDYYYSGEDYLYGGSVPATEHSVASLGGKDTELDTFSRLLDTYPSGVISIVSDTWDYWKVLTEYLPKLKDKILGRVPDNLGIAKTVIRPDSGDPVKIICGSAFRVKAVTNVDGNLCCGCPPKFEREAEQIAFSRLQGESAESNFVLTDGHKFYVAVNYLGEYNRLTLKEIPYKPEYVGSLQLLWDTFGGTITETGHKLLNERVGLIYGDSITPQRMLDILSTMDELGWCSSNILFGVGSFTYNRNTRDTLGFAMKATYGEVNGEARMLSKDPVTDSGTKKSATGCLAIVDGELIQGLTLPDFLNVENNLLSPKHEPVSLADIRGKVLSDSYLPFNS